VKSRASNRAFGPSCGAWCFSRINHQVPHEATRFRDPKRIVETHSHTGKISKSTLRRQVELVISVLGNAKFSPLAKVIFALLH
jgi:hypothetical protein